MLRHFALERRFKELVGSTTAERTRVATALDAQLKDVAHSETMLVEVQQKILSTEENLQKFEKRIREELKLKSARLTWNTRYLESRNSFGRTAILLLFLFAARF